MTKQEMIDKAKEEARAQGGWTPALEDAIEAGLIAGDRIDLGLSGTAHLVAHIESDGMIEMWHGDKMTARMPLAGMTDAQRDRMLILKAVQAGLTSYCVGTLAGIASRR